MLYYFRSTKTFLTLSSEISANSRRDMVVTRTEYFSLTLDLISSKLRSSLFSDRKSSRCFSTKLMRNLTISRPKHKIVYGSIHYCTSISPSFFKNLESKALAPALSITLLKFSDTFLISTFRYSGWSDVTFLTVSSERRPCTFS